MARYIDAEKFLENEIKRCGCVPLVGSCTTDNESLAYQLAKAPTADVVEVKHGEWIAKPSTHISKRGRLIHYDRYKCSECGVWNGRHKPDYCPKCGADMRGRSDT